MYKSAKFYFRKCIQFLCFLFISVVAGVMVLFLIVSGPPENIEEKGNEVNDVTLQNKIEVRAIKRPKTVDEIVLQMKNYDGSISIGGARHSMGGQIGSERTLHLDMREFSNVVSFSKERKEITVETGITWRKIQEYVDPFDLSVMIMQTYANFTVGGSLSVNVHGRYIGHGPIVHSVKSIKVILASGEIVEASPKINSEIFYSCIGGLGGIGVIVEATLFLTDNCKVERQVETMTVDQYEKHFIDNIRNDSLIIFHNADIYPADFQKVRAVSFYKTGKDVTVKERLKPQGKTYRVERFAMWLVSETQYGKWIRQNWGDPIYYSSEVIKWRNYEASYDANELEPRSRKASTYALQEYFVPVGHFDAFVVKMSKILRDYKVNVINVSVRHAKQDSLSVLSWARQEVFCFVIYYKQETSKEAFIQVGDWTRELIDAAISEKGTYYLPYQIHATQSQFESAYPSYNTFFAIKRKLDPMNKFRNKLWDTYFHP